MISICRAFLRAVVSNPGITAYSIVGLIIEYLLYVLCHPYLRRKFMRKEITWMQSKALSFFQAIVYTIIVCLAPVIFFPNDTAGLAVALGAVFFAVRTRI